MSVILAPVFEKDLGDVPHFDDDVDGKILADVFDDLEALAQEEGVGALGRFYHEDPAAIADLVGGNAESCETPWFEPEEGAKTVRGLLRLLKAVKGPSSAVEAAMLALENLEKLLRVATARSVRFHLQARS